MKQSKNFITINLCFACLTHLLWLLCFSIFCNFLLRFVFFPLCVVHFLLHSPHFHSSIQHLTSNTDVECAQLIVTSYLCRSLHFSWAYQTSVSLSVLCLVCRSRKSETAMPIKMDVIDRREVFRDNGMWNFITVFSFCWICLHFIVGTRLPWAKQ